MKNRLKEGRLFILDCRRWRELEDELEFLTESSLLWCLRSGCCRQAILAASENRAWVPASYHPHPRRILCSPGCFQSLFNFPVYSLLNPWLFCLMLWNICFTFTVFSLTCLININFLSYFFLSGNQEIIAKRNKLLAQAQGKVTWYLFLLPHLLSPPQSCLFWNTEKISIFYLRSGMMDGT